MSFDRRHFLEMVGVGVLAAGFSGRNTVFAEEAVGGASMEPADYTIRIGTGPVELAPEHIVSTTVYNGQFPGPLIRFKEGQRAIVDIYNDTDVPELVHWHRQMIPSEVDGAFEEGSPLCQHAACGALPSCQSPRVSASITPMCRQARI